MTYKFNILSLVFIFSIISSQSCYRLKGISISPDTNTFFIDNFKISVQNAPGTINTTFQDGLNQKIRQETRLKYNDTDPDIEFSGTFTQYSVSSVAPKPGETTAFNRLTIAVKVDFINNKDEEKDWSRSFSFYFDFPSSKNLSDIEDEAITTIYKQLYEDIFNAAFNNW